MFAAVQAVDDQEAKRKPGRQLSLQARLVVLICGLVVGTAGVLSALGYSAFTRALYAQQLREMQLINSVASTRLMQTARSAEQGMAAFARAGELRDVLAEWRHTPSLDAQQRIYQAIEGLMAAEHAYRKVQLYDVSGLPQAGMIRVGDVLLRVEDRPEPFLESPEALDLARRTPIGKVRVVGPVIDTSPGGPRVNLQVAAPVYSGSGSRVGVVYAEYDVEPVLQAARSEAAARFPGAVQPLFALVDLQGRLAGDMADGTLARQVPALLRALDAAPGGSIAHTVDLAGEPHGLAAVALTFSAGGPSRFSLLAAAAPKRQLMQETRRVFYGSLLALGLLLTVAGLLAVLVAHSLTRPLEQLVAATVSFGERQRVVRLPTGDDEVGRLGLAFARMMGQVEERNLALEREVTERERAEWALLDKARRLEASEQQYRRLYESVAAGVGVLGPAGRFQSANPTLLDLLGYRSEAELAQVDYESQVWVGPGTAAEFLRRVRREGELTGTEVQLRRRDGRLLWAVQNTRAVWDGDGEVVAYEATVLDITDRKHAEYAQRASEVRFRRLFDSNMIGIVFGNGAAALLTEANAYALNLLGYEARDLPLSLHDILPPDSAELEERVRASTLLPQAHAPLELELQRRDGSIVPVLVNIARLDQQREDFFAIVLDARGREQRAARVLQAPQVDAILSAGTLPAVGG